MKRIQPRVTTQNTTSIKEECYKQVDGVLSYNLVIKEFKTKMNEKNESFVMTSEFGMEVNNHFYLLVYPNSKSNQVCFLSVIPFTKH